ncbi:alpha-amylase family protein [Actinotalea sp. K2]|uniref:alpha-amylase family protein n=1 Tax=Actinotalea sp. K2 TaxID=2939438 RepID=UPI002016B2A2|nr:alpha-amylase family protein [Actinotalea sp. K2]MCL3861633.1 alpha-amylase family protein [Actinotalea sp. K2]
MPDWVEHAIWWHVYPLGFVGAEPQALAPGAAVEHRLPHLVAWLDHAVGLGLSGLMLGPVFASQTHGYDTVDHLRTDPRLGDGDDLAHLVEQAHARGLRVVLDGVFNHVGRGFPAFQQVLEHGPGGPTEDWFHLTWPDGAAPGTEPGYVDFEGHHALVALNHDSPQVVDHVVTVMNHWLDRGFDGWRLDAAYAVPTSFWAQVLPRVRERHPQAYVFGEVLHGDYVAAVQEAGFDAVTQYELWKAVWSSINDANFFELSWGLERHNTFLEAFAPVTFVGNHDVTRIATRITDERHLPHAFVLLLTLGGTPAVYAGDEVAMRGLKEERVGGDDAIRPTFPPTPADLPPEGWPTYHLHTELIGLRRRNPWLHRARTEVLTCTNTQLVYRVAAGDDALVVALNLSDEVLRVEGGDGEAGMQVLAAAGAWVDDGAGSGGAVEVGAHGWAVLGRV